MHFDLVTYLQSAPVIALVGATNDSSKFGNIILKDLIRKNFKVLPINPRAQAVDGIPAYPDLTAAAKDHDIGLVVYVVPPKYTLLSLKEARDLKLKHIWVQPGAGDISVRDFLEGNDFEFLIDACVMVEAV